MEEEKVKPRVGSDGVLHARPAGKQNLAPLQISLSLKRGQRFGPEGSNTLYEHLPWIKRFKG